MVEFPATEAPPRCLECNYVLRGLPDTRCPECGHEFDPLDPGTYTTKPPFVFWRFWLPFVLMTGAMSLVWAAVFAIAGVGAAATLVVPFALGGMLGYGFRNYGKWLLLTVAIVAGGLAQGFLITAGFEGMYCALILMGIALVPLVIGLFAGILLRYLLKMSSFSQRMHLPVWFFLALPLVWARLEGPTSCRYGEVSVVTSQTIDAPLASAWAGVTMYEEVRHSPPLLLRLGLSRPLYSVGSMTHVGDVKTCVYDQGKLVKRITKVEAGKQIEFEVIHQSIERCAAKLKRGSFTFEAISPTQTRVTLTTVYEPFLAPRFAWQPFEELSAHTLHQHVLLGMAENAIHPQHDPTHVQHAIPSEDSEHDHHAHP